MASCFVQITLLFSRSPDYLFYKPGSNAWYVSRNSPSRLRASITSTATTAATAPFATHHLSLLSCLQLRFCTVSLHLHTRLSHRSPRHIIHLATYLTGLTQDT